MGVSNFDDLRKHYGHKIECVMYSDEHGHIEYGIAIECETCNEVLLDYDKGNQNI